MIVAIKLNPGCCTSCDLRGLLLIVSVCFVKACVDHLGAFRATLANRPSGLTISLFPLEQTLNQHFIGRDSFRPLAGPEVHV
jgi:hypothetical protein